MEVWNVISKPLVLESGKIEKMQFLDSAKQKSQAGKEYLALRFRQQSTLLMYWLPLFKILGANITLDKLDEKRGKLVQISSVPEGYFLEFD